MDILELTELPYDKAREILKQMMSVGDLPLEHKMYYDWVKSNYSSPNDRISMIGFFRKNAWRDRFPDLQRMADAMENFRTDPRLLEYTKGIPPPSIRESVVNTYKKCISFRSKNTNKIVSILTGHSRYTQDNILVKKEGVIRDGCFLEIALCIAPELVNGFLSEFRAWNSKAYDLWNKVYYAKADFFQNSGYRYRWMYIVGDIERMKSVADELENLVQGARSLLEEGRQLVAHHDVLISSEYAQNASEISLYEREREIEITCCADDAYDEQYCYVYTLECPIGVFYVGIAADPQGRYEQHVRGAYSDEEHLFKSKIIRKYSKEVKQKVIYEGPRRECRLREKAYIAEHNPLGNMTVGGEG